MCGLECSNAPPTERRRPPRHPHSAEPTRGSTHRGMTDTHSRALARRHTHTRTRAHTHTHSISGMFYSRFKASGAYAQKHLHQTSNSIPSSESVYNLCMSAYHGFQERLSQASAFSAFVVPDAFPCHCGSSPNTMKQLSLRDLCWSCTRVVEGWPRSLPFSWSSCVTNLFQTS